MAAVTLAPAPMRQVPGETHDDFDHIFCCDENRALCGADLTDVEEAYDCADSCPLCPMCEVMNEADLGCATCGGT